MALLKPVIGLFIRLWTIEFGKVASFSHSVIIDEYLCKVPLERFQDRSFCFRNIP